MAQELSEVRAELQRLQQQQQQQQQQRQQQQQGQQYKHEEGGKDAYSAGVDMRSAFSAASQQLPSWQAPGTSTSSHPGVA